MANKRSIDWLIDQQKERSTIISMIPTVNFFSFCVSEDDLSFESIKLCFVVCGPWHSDISTKRFHRGQVANLFFSERPVLIVDLVCFCCCCFFHAGQRIWYLTSASFKSFITVFIVIRGDCWWQATSLKYKNHSTAVSVGSPLKVHNPLFSVGK